jgi:hypothetical protein
MDKLMITCLEQCVEAIILFFLLLSTTNVTLSAIEISFTSNVTAHLALHWIIGRIGVDKNTDADVSLSLWVTHKYSGWLGMSRSID